MDLTNLKAYLNMPVQFYYYLAGITVLFILGFVVSQILVKNKVKKFIEEYPEFAVLKLKSVNFLVYYNVIRAHSVNGNSPVVDGQKLYVPAGKANVELSFMKQRIGILHKYVNTSTDIIPVEFEVEANKKYFVWFNQKLGNFEIKELEK